VQELHLTPPKSLFATIGHAAAGAKLGLADAGRNGFPPKAMKSAQVWLRCNIDAMQK
jgi:hypothetical protein